MLTASCLLMLPCAPKITDMNDFEILKCKITTKLCEDRAYTFGLRDEKFFQFFQSVTVTNGLSFQVELPCQSIWIPEHTDKRVIFSRPVVLCT